MFEAGVTIFQGPSFWHILAVSFRGVFRGFFVIFLDAEAHGTSSGYPKVDASQLPEAATVTSPLSQLNEGASSQSPAMVV